MDAPLSGLEVKGVTKRFGRLVALDQISAHFAPGEIHGVLGENGAGKSTLMNVMSGFVAPDSGSVLLHGKPLPLGRPAECRRMGVEMIHQHFMLVPEFTVAENLALARLDGLAGGLDEAVLAAPALAKAKELNWEMPAKAKTSDLPVGVQQRLEILKALGGNSDVLIFDEPTAVLSPDEADDLFRVLRTLRDQGKIVILIAHKLSEVRAVCDRITVLRRGKFIATAPIGEASSDQLARWMVGELPPVLEKTPPTHLEPGLEVQDLHVVGDRGEAAVRKLNLQVQRGEIFGLGGVDGNGQVELAEALAGVRSIASGSVHWRGAALDYDEVKVAYIPQDRQEDGLAMGFTIQENLMLAGYRRPGFRQGPFLRMGSIRAWAATLIERFSIKAQDANELVASLSGGNQQKVVVSRNLDVQPDFLIAVNPTRGLDIKATEFVHRSIQIARDGGAAVLLISTDLDEVLGLADRHAFLSRGELKEGDARTALLGGAA
ncbi:MAG: ABC transporter ATP-binding protein [Fimbriimonas sp.]